MCVYFDVFICMCERSAFKISCIVLIIIYVCCYFVLQVLYGIDADSLSAKSSIAEVFECNQVTNHSKEN